MASKVANGAETTESRDEAVEGVLLDIQSAAVKKLIARGKERGYVTYDELNAALPSEQVSSESSRTRWPADEIGINVVENEESEDGEAAAPSPPPRPRTRRTEEEEPAAMSTRKASAAPTTPSACTCARWAASSCSPARARSPSPSASRPAAT